MALEPYPIGVLGQPWSDEHKAQWRQLQTVKRSYQHLVVTRIQALGASYEVTQYGTLSYDCERYPLFSIRNKNWTDSNPVILVTGGVHGYETSGVMGALHFVEHEMAHYQDKFNFVIVPCISPWGFETINRWNPNADDPNRSFYPDRLTSGVTVEESGHLMSYIKSLNCEFLCHIDLHETTDTDNSEFRPALAARDAIEQFSWNIPDGFYCVDDSDKPQPEFQQAVINAVKTVTHIALPDEHGQLIGSDMVQPGVIQYPKKRLGLCAGLTDAPYVTTTEVYPDSPKVTDEICNLAQVAVIEGALAFLAK